MGREVSHTARACPIGAGNVDHVAVIASTPALRLRRMLVPAVLLVPLVVDPFGRDKQGFKTLALALVGALVLLLEGLSGVLRPERWRRLDVPECLLALLLLLSTLSLAWATNPELGVLRVLFLVGLLGATRGVRDAVATPADARRWLGGLLAVGTLAVLLDGAAILEQGRLLSAANTKYASWLFVHNNLAAAYVTVLAPLAVVLALAPGPLAVRLASVSALAAIAGYLLLLRSRAGLLAVSLGLLIVLALLALRRRIARRRPGGRGWLVGVGLAVLLAAVLPFSEAARGRAKDLFYRGVELFQVDLGDSFFRPRLWRQTMLMVREAPLSGVGAGNFVVEYPRFERYPEVKPHAHNDALQTLAELGLPGLLLFLALGAAVVIVALGALAQRAAEGGRESRRDYLTAAGLVGALAVFGVIGLFEVPFALGASAAVLAVLIGCASGLRASAPVAAPLPAWSQASTPPPNRAGARRAIAAATALVALEALILGAQRVPATWLVTRAERAAQDSDIDEAERLLERVVALRTGSVQPFLMLASLATLRGDGEAALTQVRAARRLWPHNAELAESEGDKLAALGRFDEAVDCFEESHDLSPARDSSLFKLVTALDQSGQLQAAIDLLEYQVRSNSALTLDSVRKLADMWRRRAEQLSGDERTWALVASRHFYAVLLDEAPPAWWPQLDPTFKDLTHRLQILPGAPQSWFDVYRRFMEQGGWNMPASALYTSVGRDGFRLFPGWVEPYGPPMPGAWRRP